MYTNEEEKERGKPWWMTKKVMRMIRKKRRMWRFYPTDPRARHDYNQYQAYKKIQKEVQAAVKNAKRNYERKLAKDCKKTFWPSGHTSRRKQVTESL